MVFSLLFLSLPTTSLLFCITELFSATASLSAILILWDRFFSDGKRTEHKKRTCSVKATAGSILHSGATIIQPAERYYPQQKILLSSSRKQIQKAIRYRANIQKHFLLLESLLLRPSRSNPASYCADSYINAVLQFKQEELTGMEFLSIIRSFFRISSF